MAEYRVTIKAIVSVDDPDTLSRLILCRMTEDKAGEETISTEDDDFKVIEYPDDWLDFTEAMRKDISDSCYYANCDGDQCSHKEEL